MAPALSLAFEQAYRGLLERWRCVQSNRSDYFVTTHRTLPLPAFSWFA
jgi:hypothetical protein